MFSESNFGWLLAAEGIASGLQNNSSLTYLSVEKYVWAVTPPCFLGDTLTQLLKAVANHPSLASFSIWTGNLREEYIRGILGVLSSNNTLLSLAIQTTTCRLLIVAFRRMRRALSLVMAGKFHLNKLCHREMYFVLLKLILVTLH